MSAIFGLMYRDTRPLEPGPLESMNEILRRHGPDGEGFITDGNAGIGYRLHRFTPEDRYEYQPRPLGERLWLVNAGRIDNRKELRESLGIGEGEASAMPDSAFIGEAWKRWAPSARLG